jgi:hypothetical protein
MIKKFFALAATALLSLNANAGYVQYNFTGSVSGYVIQHDNNGAIADFDLAVWFPSGGTTNFFEYTSDTGYIVNAGTHFPQDGPTEFFMMGYSDSASLDFNVRYKNIVNDAYEYSAHTNGGFKIGENFEDVESMLYGVATKGTVDPQKVAILDESGGFAPGVWSVTPIVYPAQKVTEPASLALFGIAVLGMGAHRRRKAARNA